jgi:hypothetical protein
MGQCRPGPLCVSEVGANWIDEGTMCRSRSSPPGPIGVGVGSMSVQNKVAAAISAKNTAEPTSYPSRGRETLARKDLLRRQAPSDLPRQNVPQP